MSNELKSEGEKMSSKLKIFENEPFGSIRTVEENGKVHTKVHTYWTQKGRLFIYDLLKDFGIFPLIEREYA